jgi:hypothetical protein
MRHVDQRAPADLDCSQITAAKGFVCGAAPHTRKITPARYRRVEREWCGIVHGKLHRRTVAMRRSVMERRGSFQTVSFAIIRSRVISAQAGAAMYPKRRRAFGGCGNPVLINMSSQV